MKLAIYILYIKKKNQKSKEEGRPWPIQPPPSVSENTYMPVSTNHSIFLFFFKSNVINHI
jgi:hypothetical protein